MRKRNHVVPVRLNAKELRHLDGQVAKSGLSREEFLRSLILGAQLQTKPCEHHAELLRKSRGFATMRTSWLMSPMEQGGQGKPAYRKCFGFPKRPGVW